MRTLAGYVLSISAAATSLAGCAASPQSAFDVPRAAQGSLPTGQYARNLLYVTAGLPQVFTYPRGKPVGSLGVFASYLCSDRLGNIFVTGGEGISYVWIFAHGSGQPMATLYNPQNAGGCSVEKNSGNLAVADADASPVVIFPYNRKRGWRLARQYNDPDFRASLYCAYDPQGNLFVDGYNTSGAFMLAELPKGSSTFTTIALDQTVHRPGSLQWVGNDLAIEDAGASSSSEAVIYEFTINGTYGHKMSATTLTDSAADAQFLIHGKTVIGPLSSTYAKGIGIWHFPSGSAPVSTIFTYGYPTGEALSLK